MKLTLYGTNDTRHTMGELRNKKYFECTPYAGDNSSLFGSDVMGTRDLTWSMSEKLKWAKNLATCTEASFVLEYIKDPITDDR